MEVDYLFSLSQSWHAAAGRYPHSQAPIMGELCPGVVAVVVVGVVVSTFPSSAASSSSESRPSGSWLSPSETRKGGAKTQTIKTLRRRQRRKGRSTQQPRPQQGQPHPDRARPRWRESGRGGTYLQHANSGTAPQKWVLKLAMSRFG